MAFWGCEMPNLENLKPLSKMEWWKEPKRQWMIDRQFDPAMELSEFELRLTVFFSVLRRERRIERPECVRYVSDLCCGGKIWDKIVRRGDWRTESTAQMELFPSAKEA
jgi:hypothetical protein